MGTPSIILERMSSMVIQPNMTSKAIVEVWKITKQIFENHNIDLSENSLETVIQGADLTSILRELNNVIGSSNSTCIKGG
jgi:hypothetical protein